MGIPIGECKKCLRSYERTHRTAEDWMECIDREKYYRDPSIRFAKLGADTAESIIRSQLGE